MKYIAVSTFAICSVILLVLGINKLEEDKTGSATVYFVGSLFTFSSAMALVEHQ